MSFKSIFASLAVAILLLAAASPALAASDEGYTYSYWGEPNPAPAAYLPVKVLYGGDLHTGPLSEPSDMFVGKDRSVYIADTGNNRVIVLDDRWNTVRIIRDFVKGGKKDAFNGPEGVFVSDAGDIYVADTQNRRIVRLAADGTFVRETGEPKSTLLRQGFQFAPTKLVADKSGQMYVISRGSYEGIMQFDADGAFTGFVGTNRVQFNPVDLLWKRISTKGQREQMQQFVPVEFNNVDIEDNGFLYTTTSEENADKPIKRLNVSGVDILRSKGYFPPKGDIKFLQTGSRPGSSIFVDVAADEGGMYSALDSKRGRVFAYDKDGNLLYEFGGIGSSQGLFRTPAAIGISEGRTLVLDKGYNRLTVFEPTQYGGYIREAVRALYDGKADESTAAWRNVLKLNSNFEVAYLGIGKSLMKKGDNKGAMANFKLGNNREYYSEAFKRYRQQVVFEGFGYIVLGVAAAALLILAAVKLAARRTAGRHYEEVGILKNPFYTMIHPFNGFWEMKYENKGRIKLSLAILLLMVLFAIVKRQYSGFVVNFNNLSQLNSLNELKFVVLPFLLWCVANWSLTTLMDGEGKFKDIVMATGYSLMPFIVIYLPQTLYSNIITMDEGAFYYLLDVVALIWFIWLLFVGTMTVHQYTPGKTVLTMALTLVVIGIILFLGLLFFSMMQQLVSFFISIYRELAFRL